MAARVVTEEEAARNRQNVLIAESCQHLKETSSLNPYRDYGDAAMKLLGYHILADVDHEAADVSETFDGAGHKLLMSARHVWDEHLQRRADSCITTLATLHDNLSSRTRTPAQASAGVAPTTAEATGGGAAKATRAYEDLKVEEWMREARLDWESAVRTEVSKLDEEIVQVRYKRQCVEHDIAMHKEAEEAKMKGLPPPAPRPYAPPPAASQAPNIPPNPVAPPPVASQPAAAPVAQYAQQQTHAAAPQHRAPMFAAASRPGTLRPAGVAYGARAAAAQSLRPAYSTASTQAGQPRASAGAYTHVRPAAPHAAMAAAGPPVVMSQSAAAAYASWQAAAAGLPPSAAAAAPATAAQPAQPAQPAPYNMAFANRPPPTIPNEEAQRRARMLVDVHRAQVAQTSITAGRALQGARGGARRPAAPQMAARPAMRPAGATDLSQTGEPVRRGVGRPPGRGRGRGRGPGRLTRPSTTVDL